ncbi:MAG: ATP-binding protein [Gaiellaceae bacterium]
MPNRTKPALSLRRRFSIGIAFMVIPMLLLGGASVFASERSVRASERVADQTAFELVPITDLSAKLRGSQLPALATIFAGQPIRCYRAAARDVDRAFASLLERDDLADERADLELALALWSQAKAELELVFQSPITKLPPQDRVVDPTLLAAVTAPLNGAIAATERAAYAAAKEIQIESGNARDLQHRVELLLGLTGLVAILSAALIARRLSRSVVDPIVRLQEASRKLGDRNFTERVSVDRADEIGALAVVFNTMADDLERHDAELRESHERLIQAQKMEAVGQLAGGIAHDFNNLLLIVGSYADMLHESFEDDDPRRADASEIRLASDRAAALTRQLLTFSRKDVTQPVPVDTVSTIERLEPMLRRTLTAAIDLRLELEPGLRATVIDPGQLEQAILNLLLNARNAMPDGGTLTIRADAVVVDDEHVVDGVATGAYVAIAVADTGVGMSEAVQSRALEPFFTTRADAGGSGLGLATVYGIVTAAGGAITIDSTPGDGTTFVLYLPTTTGNAVVRTAPDTPTAPMADDRAVVLLAEDEPTIRDLTTRILTSHGYTVLAAASGAEALELARTTSRIDVLLTDVVMPAMTGRELAASLLLERPDGLRTIYMSGYSDDAVAEDGVLDPETLYLQKPFRPQQLLELVAGALARPV